MSAIVAILVVVAVLAAGILGTLAVVVFGIRGEERRMSLGEPPRTLAGFFTRRILGVHADPHEGIQRARAQSRR